MMQYVLQLELLHDSKGAADNEYCFQHFAAHLGMDGHVRSGGVSCAIGLIAHACLPCSEDRASQMPENTQPG